MDDEPETMTINSMLRYRLKLHTLSNEELIELRSSKDLTSALFQVVEHEVVRRITGGSKYE